MDKFIEMVCMDLGSLPNGMIISNQVIDAAIQEAKGKVERGAVAGFIGGSNIDANLEVVSIYRVGRRVYCRARVLTGEFPIGDYGLTCGGAVERIRDSITQFSFCSVGLSTILLNR